MASLASTLPLTSPSRVSLRARNSRRAVRGASRLVPRASSEADDAMKDEDAGAAQRTKESAEAGVRETRAPRGGDPPPTGGGWEWTLNWDPIVFDESGAIADPSDAQLAEASLIVGSCPRSPEDVDRLVDEGGVEAIICLQCELCHGALKIDWAPIRARAPSARPHRPRPVRDFDRLDQAKMLPEMVRKLALFQAMGSAPTSGGTAGINRAPLTALGYLTFVRGMEYARALEIVRECRPQANPYAASRRSRAAAAGGRSEDLTAHAG